MAYIIVNRRGAFEARESRPTADGPRSRTLATFHELDQKTIEKITSRAENPPSPLELRDLALRAGAPLAAKPVDAAARAMLRSLARGEKPTPKLRRLLLDALDGEPRQAAEWLGASLAERGEALRDLLGLGDAMPIRHRPDKISFPRINSIDDST
ncbi:MAG TPA: hypothetical protein VHE08_07820 [Solirubrobacterales bacterium]|nr:hypothetical protein [Solirubrobacterales bacterium]